MKRFWVKSGVCALVVMMAMNFVGCDGGSTSWRDRPAESVDLIVVGTGIAGGLAALAYLEVNPNANVLVIDKMHRAGGSTLTSGQNFTGLQASVPLPAGDWDQQVIDASGQENFIVHWRRNALVAETFPFPDFQRTWQTFVAARTEIQWMHDYMNIPFAAYSQQVTAPALGYNPRMLRRLATGSFIGNMIAELDRRGAEVRQDKEMIGLLTDDGAVIGIAALDRPTGRVFEITANNVIIATGGFALNHALVALFANEYDQSLGLRDWAFAGNICPSNTGSGISIAMRDAGADVFRHSYPGGPPSMWGVLTGMNTFPPFTMTGPGGNTISSFTVPTGGAAVATLWRNVQLDEHGDRPAGAAQIGTGAAAVANPEYEQYLFGLQDQIIVNILGERFYREDAHAGSAGFNNIINAMGNQPGPSWIILSTDTTTPAMRTTLNAMAAVPNQNVVVRADTPAELAELAGISSGLVQTITAYNALAGTDGDLLGKAEERMVALEGEWLYAVRIRVQALGTIGGLRTGPDGQVLDGSAEGVPIPGLFAVGEVSNRPFFGQGYVGGSCLSLFAALGPRVGRFVANQE